MTHRTRRRGASRGPARALLRRVRLDHHRCSLPEEPTRSASRPGPPSVGVQRLTQRVLLVNRRWLEAHLPSSLDTDRGGDLSQTPDQTVGKIPTSDVGWGVDEELIAAGERIRASMGPGMTQRLLAQQVGMTPDALSRALSGQRGFTMRELTRIADTLKVDLTWLMTGRPDPHRMTFAARYHWDERLRERSNPGEDADGATRTRIGVLYRVALPEGPPASEALPADPADMRSQLGPDFVRRFAELVETQLGVDVVRIAGMTTDYSLSIGQRGVIVLKSTPNWFRSNWSLAHELGHLALGHHGNGAPTDAAEGQANRFAADLLLPRDELIAQNWATMTEHQLAGLLWSAGVSTQALRTRLANLAIETTPAILAALDRTTPALLRDFGNAISSEEVADRQQAASVRRFPLGLLDSLTSAVGSGTVAPEELAWALDVPVDEIDFPDQDDASAVRAYDRMLADRPSLEDLLAGVRSR